MCVRDSGLPKHLRGKRADDVPTETDAPSDTSPDTSSATSSAGNQLNEDDDYFRVHDLIEHDEHDDGGPSRRRVLRPHTRELMRKLEASLEALQDMGVRDEDGYWHEPLAFAERPRYGNEREDADSAQRALEVFDWEYAAGDTTSAPGVPFWCVYSLGTDTVTSFTYRTADMSDTPTPINGDGDATVHAQSLQVRAKTGRFYAAIFSM